MITISTITSPVRRAIRSTTGTQAIAIVALIAACSGTAYAAATIGTAQVIDNSLRGVDVRNGTLTSLDVANGTLTGTDIRDGSITGNDLADNSVGSSKVEDGSLQRDDLSAATLDSVSNKWQIRGTMKTAAGGAHVTEQFLCDYANGEYAAGGGGYSYYDAKGYLTGSTPVYGTGVHANMPIGWEVSMQNLSGSTNYLIVRVTCVRG